MEQIYHVIVATIFTAWFILTIINQFNYDWVKKVKQYDLFHLLPRWTFFAPNPGTSDYHLVYRTMDVENNITKFTEISLLNRKEILSAFWNADKRVKKALSDLVMDINRLCSQKEINEQNIKLSFSYIAILNFLTSIKKDKDEKLIQFAILKSDGFFDRQEPSLIICSEFHLL